MHTSYLKFILFLHNNSLEKHMYYFFDLTHFLFLIALAIAIPYCNYHCNIKTEYKQ